MLEKFNENFQIIKYIYFDILLCALTFLLVYGIQVVNFNGWKYSEV